MIYIATLILSTFWVQDIFDYLMEQKISKLKEEGGEVSLIRFQPMSAKQLASDLVGRTMQITIYIILCNLICAAATPSVGAFVEILTQSLLISFYCFEYKTAAAGIDTPVGLALFEKQWIYFFGFGFPFTLTMWLLKSIGSSVFFLFFPFLVMLSIDENGQGLQLVRTERKTHYRFPLFSYAMEIKLYLLDMLSTKIADSVTGGKRNKK